MKILYLHCHDMGRVNSLYGYPVSTPMMERFSENAVTFQNAFCASPTCSPSRAALLTGMYPSSNGMQGLAHLGHVLRDPSRHMAAYLQRHGFKTGLCGVQHEAEDPMELGYEEVYVNLDQGQCFQQGKFDGFSANDCFTVAGAMDFIRKHQEDSFFLSCGFYYPHRAFLKAREDDRGFSVSGLPPAPEVEADLAAYGASVRFCDSMMGMVLDYLEEVGLYDEMLIILTTDHGIPFPRMKCNLYDGGIGVTLAIKMPGMRGKRRCDTLVSHIDLFPTICDIAGIPHPQWLQGYSLLPLLEGQTSEIRHAIFAQTDYHVVPEAARLVRTQRYAYIRRFVDDGNLRSENVDTSPSKKYMNSALKRIKLPKEELFDLWTDPGQKRNLIGHSARHNEIKKQMKGLLLEHLTMTGDLVYAAQMQGAS